MRNILRFVFFGLLILLVLTILLAAGTQTQFFRDRLRSVVLTQLDSLFLADVRVGPIEGNLVAGFSVDSIAFRVANEPVMSVERIDFRYNLLGIPGRTISVSSLTLVHPEVHIRRLPDGSWNTSHLLRPTPPESKPPQPFSWSVVVKRLEIQNGLLELTDSLAMREAGDTLIEHRHGFTARNINALIAARYAPDEKYLNIQRLTGSGIARNVDLLNLTGEFTLTPESAAVKNLSIATGRSLVRLSASLGRVDLLKGFDLAGLEHKPTTLSLQGTPVNLRELQDLVPGLGFLNGDATIELDASGEFGKLALHRLDLTTRRTKLQWKGSIFNLHKPENLALAVRLTDGTIDPGDIVDLMPSFDLPDFRPLGATTLNLEFDGRPTDFRTKFDIASTAGKITSDIALKIGGPAALRYQGDVTGEGVNPALLFNDPRLQGTVNATAHIEGEGVTFEHLASNFQLTLENSVFRDLSIPTSKVTVDARNKVLTMNGSLGLGEMVSSIALKLDKRDINKPAFTVDAAMKHLDIASIAHDEKYESDITAKLSLDGHGLTWATLGGHALLDLSSSQYRGYSLDSGEIHVTLDQTDPKDKLLTLNSPVADMNLAGAFNLEWLTRLVKFEVQNLNAAIDEKFRFLDSTLVPSVDRRTLESLRASLATQKDTTNLRYAVTFKDLEPIAAIAGQTSFRGEGMVHGTIRGSLNNIALDGNLQTKYFFLGNVERGFLLQNATVDFALDHLTPVNPLRQGAMHVRTVAERMNINHMTLDSLASEVSYRNEFARYSFTAIVDSVLRGNIETSARVTDAGIASRINRLEFSYKGYDWSADTTTSFTLTSADASLKNLVLRHDSTVVRFDGSLGAQQSVTADITADHLNLADLQVLGSARERQHGDDLVRGGASLAVQCSGTLPSPVMSATLRAAGLAFKRIPFGNLTADCQYADTVLHVTLLGGSLGATDGVDSAVTVRGTFPINLGFTGVDERLPDRPMDLTVLSRGMQMSLFDPLIPAFDELSGIMRCRLTISGTPRSPEYGGSMTLDACEFLFVPNNIRYNLNAVLQPSGERIKVLDATIRNVAADERPGRKGEMHIRGDFAFSDFTPGDFNLVGEGSLLVVKETSRLSDLSLYGNLFMETGPGGLRFTGEIDNSLLRGYVITSNSNLVFPPTESMTTREESQVSIPVQFVDDTTKIQATRARTALAEFFIPDSVLGRTPGSTENIATKSFVDGIHYDLDVETVGGNTQIRMIFNSITNEELVANIDGRLNITGDGRQWMGDLTVSRAYYNFFKRFNAEGSLHFHGNVMNPELDLTATYEGTRADTSGKGSEDVVATFKITGTRMEPKVDISMTINSEDYYTYHGPKSNDVRNDAIEFILYGNFPLSSSQRASAGTDIGSTVSNSLVTGAGSLLTGALSEFLRNQTKIITQVDFSYDSRGTDIRLSGVAWNGLWQYGGKILDNPFSNANFSIQYSFGTILNEPTLRNLMFELERKIELNPLSPTNDLKAVNSARLFYKFSF